MSGLVVSLGTLLYMMWPAFRIPFGIIDDHEIVDMIGDRPRLPLSELPGTFVDRADEDLGRFRPLYWLFRAIESSTAGQNSTWWYVDRFVLAAITVVALYVLLIRFVPAPWATVISLLPFAGPQAETWSRLERVCQ